MIYREWTDGLWMDRRMDGRSILSFYNLRLEEGKQQDGRRSKGLSDWRQDSKPTRNPSFDHSPVLNYAL